MVRKGKSMYLSSYLARKEANLDRKVGKEHQVAKMEEVTQKRRFP